MTRDVWLFREAYMVFSANTLNDQQNKMWFVSADGPASRVPGLIYRKIPHHRRHLDQHEVKGVRQNG